ncbi:MAG: AbrB/MazE/SpoVT family DNA-binding domain-containing protein [Defluviitaleaceae bacterium]|nr:AbrB/MazE/SpoVT family DNA-binding domain-containing protein [Defluviitaleaceae bacterium]
MTTSITNETGAIRTVDELGRIVLPRATREALGIYTGDQFEVITQDTTIILVRHAPTCLACNDDTNVEKMNKTFLCEVCREALQNTIA